MFVFQNGGVPFLAPPSAVGTDGITYTDFTGAAALKACNMVVVGDPPTYDATTQTLGWINGQWTVSNIAPSVLIAAPMRRTILSGVTDSTGTATIALNLSFDPTPVGLTLLSSTTGARAAVASISRTSISIKVVSDPPVVTAAGIKVLSGASDQVVANATVIVELVRL